MLLSTEDSESVVIELSVAGVDRTFKRGQSRI